MDQFEENCTFEIQGIRKHVERGITRYDVQIDKKYYLSNNWFEGAVSSRFEAFTKAGLWIECKSVHQTISPVSKKRELRFVI